MALSGRRLALSHVRCWGVERTSFWSVRMSASDPKRSWGVARPPLRFGDGAFVVILRSYDPEPVPLQWELRVFRRGGNVRHDD
jgi:hypothetical protein